MAARGRCWLALLSVLFLLFVTTGCTSRQTDERPLIKLAQNPWSASIVNVAVAKILLEEQLGFPVEIVAVDENEQWPQIAAGDIHASLEVWPSGHASNVARYIQDEKSVVDGGFLGPVGRISWYIPTYLLADHPELSNWEGLQKPENVALFATDETGDQGRFLAGDPSWVQYDADIIRNLGLNFEVITAGSEEAMLAELENAYNQRQPLLFYFWTPHSLHAKYDLTAVSLPPYSEECYAEASSGGVACSYPPDPLFKIFWSDLEDYAPLAYDFLRNFNYTTRDQIGLIAQVDLEGKSGEEAARTWVEQNEHIWQTWIPAEE
jgi:glycine betaine/proline transport system substrate-binding protein